MTLDLNTIKTVLDRFADVCYYSGNLLEFLFCLVLVSHFVKKAETPLCGAFFHILFINYVLDIAYELGFTFQRYLTRDINANNAVDLFFIKYFESALEWYFLIFLGPANVLIALNRLTSIVFMTKHKLIWTKFLPLILGVLLLSPIIIGGFTFGDIHCRFNVYAPECLGYMKRDFLICSISNFVCAVISLIIGCLTAYIYAFKFQHHEKNKQLKIEHKLLIQSVISSIMFAIYTVSLFLHPFFFEQKDNQDFYVIYFVYKFCYVIAYSVFHYGSIIMLFVFSKAVRNEFVRFYHITWLFGSSKTRVSSITQSSSIQTFSHRVSK